MTQGYTTTMYINLKTKVNWGHIEKGAHWYNFERPEVVKNSTNVEGRHPQDVDVLTVLDFQIPCPCPETLGFYNRTSAMTLRTGTQRSRTARTKTS